MASGGGDRYARLWDATTGKDLRVLKGHTSDVYAVAFSVDGLTLATGSEDKTVKLWRVATGELLRTCKGHTATVSAVNFSPDGKLVVSGSWDFPNSTITPPQGRVGQLGLHAEAVVGHHGG